MTPVQPEPILLYHIRLTPDDVCLKRLIEFFGLSCKTVDTSAFGAELHRAADHDLCILASAETIDRWCHNLPDRAAALGVLQQKASFLFVYGFAPGKSLAYIAGSLSDGAIEDVSALTGGGLNYQVSSSEPEITREFSGLSFGCARNGTDSGFVSTENSSSTVPLVTIADMPFWVVVEKNSCKTFLLACSTIADIQEQASGIDAGQVESLITERTAARARKDFRESDRIRDELAAMGVVIKDSKTGTTWEIAR